MVIIASWKLQFTIRFMCWKLRLQTFKPQRDQLLIPSKLNQLCVLKWTVLPLWSPWSCLTSCWPICLIRYPSRFSLCFRLVWLIHVGFSCALFDSLTRLRDIVYMVVTKTLYFFPFFGNRLINKQEKENKNTRGIPKDVQKAQLYGNNQTHMEGVRCKWFRERVREMTNIFHSFKEKTVRTISIFYFLVQ